MKPVKIYNTLTRSVELFKPTGEGEVRMYACGPTVYDYVHIGNFRTYINEDILRRVLELAGYNVAHVVNVTDVGHLTTDADSGEDKVEKASKQSGMSARQLADKYEEAFWEEWSKLNLLRPTLTPHATEFIPQQIAFVKGLMEKGFVYEAEDGLYFDVTKLPDYGKLWGQDLKDKLAGARVEVDTSKRNQADFAVWKFSPKNEKRQMEWEFEGYGMGFPGWHLECSVMAEECLGELPIDIHAGGVDHISVHHSNEIAQTEALRGKPLANYWFHGEFLNINAQKMSKSLKNFTRVLDLDDPMAFKFLCYQTHYRKQMEFTDDSYMAAKKGLAKLRGLARTALDGEDSSPEELWQPLFNDLNVAEFVAGVMKFGQTPQATKDFFAHVDDVLALDIFKETIVEIPAEVQELMDRRAEARESGNYALSDSLREQIRGMGFEVEDKS